jgi:hypothetical protein
MHKTLRLFAAAARGGQLPPTTYATSALTAPNSTKPGSSQTAATERSGDRPPLPRRQISHDRAASATGTSPTASSARDPATESAGNAEGRWAGSTPGRAESPQSAAQGPSGCARESPRATPARDDEADQPHVPKRRSGD